ncbi:MAG TPA: hypothetical protein VM487_00080 [Phycisphaerae bacterium]|nr:hypothetical protein [Phycisphaerae bacterium]
MSIVLTPVGTRAAFTGPLVVAQAAEHHDVADPAWRMKFDVPLLF